MLLFKRNQLGEPGLQSNRKAMEFVLKQDERTRPANLTQADDDVGLCDRERQPT